MELSNAQLAVANIVLLKFPVKQAVVTPTFMDEHLLIGYQDQFDPGMFLEIQNLLESRDRAIRTFLLKAKYLETVDHTVPRNILTKKGEKAQGLRGHSQYL